MMKNGKGKQQIVTNVSEIRTNMRKGPKEREGDHASNRNNYRFQGCNGLEKPGNERIFAAGNPERKKMLRVKFF